MAVLLEERTNLEQGVADGSRAHLEQLGEHASGADAALVENGRQDSFRVGDLLAEDATAGSGQACPAAPLMAASFNLGGLLDRQPLDQLVQLWTAHAGQGWVGQDCGQPRTPDGGAVVDEVEKGLLAGKAEGRGGDGVSVLVEELPGFGDRLADRERVHLDQVREDLLGADLAKVDDGDQDPVCVTQQRAAVCSGCFAAWSAALLVAALFGLGGLRGCQACGQRVEFLAAYAGQQRIRQHRKGL